MVNYEVLGQETGFDYLRLTLSPGDEVFCETGALVSMDEAITMKTQTGSGGKTGFFAGIKRALAGEDFFTLKLRNETEDEDGDVYISANSIGEIVVIDLADYNGEIVVKQGAYFAHINREETINMSIYAPRKKAFLDTGFMTKITGDGIVFIGSDGLALERELEENTSITVDEHNLLMYQASMSVSMVYKGFKNTFFGGEGIMLKIQGPGTVMLNSHDVRSFIRSQIPPCDKK